MTEAKKYTIGVDIGGTNMKAVLWDGEKVLEDYTLATPKDNLEHFFIMLNALIDPLLEKAKENKAKIKGVGIGVAGLYDTKKRKVVKAPNIALLDGVDLAERMEKDLNLPIQIDNDVNCFVRAEALIGSGKKYKNIFGITIGTGIGGAWWTEKTYKGFRGGAGEIGRMILEDSQELESIYKNLSQGNPANLAEEAYRGDALAQKSFEEIGRYLGIACANLVNLLDPEVIIIGGGATEADDLFLSKLKKTTQELIMNPEAKNIKIIKAKLGESVGAIGASLQIP